MIIPIESTLDLASSGLVPFLVGKRGEGKTSYIEMIAEHLGLTEDDCITLNLSVIEAQDFSGLPKDVGGVMVYSRPYFFNRKLIFLDEMDRVTDRAVLAGLLSLIVDRSINGHKLDDGTLILAAGNGSGAEYDTVDFDEALKDRIIQVPFEYTLAEKLDYFKAKYPDHTFVEFMSDVKYTKSVLEKFSGRRIEAFIKTSGSRDACKYILDSKLANVYNTFVESKRFNVEGFLKGEISPTSVNAVGANMLIDDMISKFMTAKVDRKGANIWSTFINGLDRESFVRYAKGLSNIVHPQLNSRNKELSDLGFFKGHAEGLKDLILNRKSKPKIKATTKYDTPPDLAGRGTTSFIIDEVDWGGFDSNKMVRMKQW